MLQSVASFSQKYSSFGCLELGMVRTLLDRLKAGVRISRAVFK